METRLLWAAMTRKRGAVGLAILAVAIGASVASALLHVSGDISRKLAHELRVLGPNLLLVPASSATGSANAWDDRATTSYLDEAVARDRLAAAGLPGVAILYGVGRARNQAVLVVGTDIEAAIRIHPGWKVSAGPHGSLIGVRLMRRLGVGPSDALALEYPGGGHIDATVTGRLESGGPDDEAWWLPLSDVQRWSGLRGKASLFQVRVSSGPEATPAIIAALERGGGMRALPLHPLSATEAGLLERMRHLMLLVTVAALISAGLCAFGTLTDLALERRREIALMKALGAGRRDVARQFAIESIAIGLIGGMLGWLLGLLMAEVIGAEVFHSPVAMRWDVPPIVLALSIAVAGLASFGPMRLALAVEPAAALKGE